MSNPCVRLAAYLILCCCFISNSHANTAEIQHLLTFIKNTQCKYMRNGTPHSGEEAVKHIEKKYNYFADDIQTTEDFIRLSASESTMSGKAYSVICDGKTTSSAQWLLDELREFRQGQIGVE